MDRSASSLLCVWACMRVSWGSAVLVLSLTVLASERSVCKVAGVLRRGQGDAERALRFSSPL